MGAKSRRKGARAEVEFAHWLQDNLGLPARRGQQRSGLDTADVIDGIPDTHCECKRVEKLNIHAAMKQAIEDAGELIPYVAFRRNRGEWLITIRASDLVAFAEAVFKGIRW